MKVLVDAQLPASLVAWFIDRGHEARHVSQVGLLAARDHVIAEWAEVNDHFVVSKDADFLTLRQPDRFGVIWLRCGNITNPALTRWLTQRWPSIESLIADGRRLVEVR